MKKFTKIAVLTLVLMMLSMSFAFADTLKLENTYPLEGQTGVALENFGIKLTFSGEFSAEKLGNSNDKAFSLVGPYMVGKELKEEYSFPLKVLYSEETPNEVLVLIDKDSDNRMLSLVTTSEYTFTVKGEFTDNNGNTLGEDKVIKFQTLNQQRNNMVNTFMMFGMFGVIILVTMKSQKKSAEKEKAPKKEEAFNPYKEAKRTGKTVEEVILEQERKEKKKKLKKEKKIEKVVTDSIIYLEDDEYYVTTLRAIPAEKSEFVKAYKEAKEAKRALEIERKKAQKAKKAKKK